MAKKRRVPSVSDAIFGKPLRLPKNPLGLPTQQKKGTRRAFTATQKKEILYQQDNRCASAYCHHKKLDPRATHFHHAKPWAYGGRTKVENGRALCADCHEIITHNDRLKRVDKKRKPRNVSPFSYG